MKQLEITRKLVRVRNRRKKPQFPHLSELFFYAFLVFTLINMLSSESRVHSTFYPLLALAQLLCIFSVVAILLHFLTNMPWKVAFSGMFHPMSLCIYAVFLGTFFLTLALHFPFVLDFGG